jgi:hypothetical protein
MARAIDAPPDGAIGIAAARQIVADLVAPPIAERSTVPQTLSK